MDVLAGMDDIPWASLRHCFRTSNDIPDLLRATAAGSEQALAKLGDYVVQPGTLFATTPYLVRFLARIAASGVASAEILELLGIAAGNDGADQAPDIRGQTRAALAEEIATLGPLLADPSDAVREVAAWALPQSLAVDRLVPLLLERWGNESVPRIAASVLRGLSFLDPVGTVALATGALASEHSAIRLIAASACAAGGVAWSGDLAEAALAWTADGTLLKGFLWSFWSGHPFGDLIDALAARRDPGAAIELVTAALTRPVASGVREIVMWTTGRLADSSRSAASALIGPLISVVIDENPEASTAAILLLRKLGALVQAAGELAMVADAEGPSRRADWALTSLVQIGDPRCIRLVVRDQRHRTFAVGALRGIGQSAVRPIPFSAALLDEVRACLRGELLGEDATPNLVGLIGSWGPAAQAAIPDLLEILPRHADRVGRALADIAGAIPEAVSLLREAAADGASLDAATRLRALTGDEEPLLAAIESGLDRTGYDLRRAAEAARTLRPTARLIPAVTAALGAAVLDNRTWVELVLALWHHSGDPAPAVGIIAGVLRADTPDRFRGADAASAARAAAVIGPTAAPLIPAILPLLDSPADCAAAAMALLRVNPVNQGGVRIEALAERLLSPLEGAWSHDQMAAVEALGEIGLPRLPARAVDRLRELATQDRRIVHSGHVQAFIRDDDRLRAAILSVIGDPGRPTSTGECG